MSNDSKRILVNWLLLLITPLCLLNQHVNQKSEWLPFFFFIALILLPEMPTLHILTPPIITSPTITATDGHLCLLLHISFYANLPSPLRILRWSRLFVKRNRRVYIAHQSCVLSSSWWRSFHVPRQRQPTNRSTLSLLRSSWHVDRSRKCTKATAIDLYFPPFPINCCKLPNFG